jgi:hypothetical protein
VAAPGSLLTLLIAGLVSAWSYVIAYGLYVFVLPGP